MVSQDLDNVSSKTIQTFFTTDGTSLTQHILHTVEGVKYPVTADPCWSFAMVSYTEWVHLADGWSLHVHMTPFGIAFARLDPWDAFSEVMQKTGIGWSRKFYYQFVCHAYFAYPWKKSWNLDMWRSDVSYFDTVRWGCNPPA